MSRSEQQHPIRGVLAGVAGGLVAAWVMNEFTARARKPLQHALQSEEQNRAMDRSEAEQTSSPQPDATMKAADRIVNTVSGGEHLSWQAQQTAGPAVHYTFGALMGGLYGGLAEYSSLVRAGFGTTFGGVLFAAADLFAVPALRLSGAPGESDTVSLATPLAAHLVYGATTELVRRAVRPLL